MSVKKRKSITAFVLCLLIILAQTLPGMCMETAVKAEESAESFTGASGKSGDLEWNITKEGHLTITGDGDYKKDIIYVDENRFNGPEWLKYYKYIKTAQLNITNITSANCMFAGCSGLTSLDVSHFDTSKVTSMSYMFAGCSGLTSLDVSHFNTSNVEYMYSMFYGCAGLTSLNVSNFDTSKVTNMYSMFYGCGSLTDLDVSHFNTSNVTDMGSMFENCNSLTNLDVSHFDTSNVTDISYMFAGCSSLTSLDVSSFNTSNVTLMSGMFYGCSGLTSLDVSSFDTSKVTNMKDMFEGCSVSTNIKKKVSKDNINYNVIFVKGSGTVQITDAQKDVKKIVIPASIEIENRNYNVTTIANGAFKGNKNLTSVTIGKNIDTIGKDVFKDCKNLKNIIIKTGKLTAGNVGKGAFKNTSKNATFKVPDGKAEAYRKIIKAKGGAGKNIKIN